MSVTQKCQEDEKQECQVTSKSEIDIKEFLNKNIRKHL